MSRCFVCHILSDVRCAYCTQCGGNKALYWFFFTVVDLLPMALAPASYFGGPKFKSVWTLVIMSEGFVIFLSHRQVPG
jgi:hypothetical protein